jgi:hypothetical protein
MVKLGQWLTAGVVALAVMTADSPALADSEAPPLSYKQIAPGGKYVFVMISPVPLEQEVERRNEEMAAGIREIRRFYTRSGLYCNDGSLDPLWTVKWYANGIVVASDGIHLIRYGPWAVRPKDRKSPLGAALDQEALSFFANGQLLRTYRIGELVDDPDRLPRSVSHFEWRGEGELDDARSEYTLTTLDGNRFVFDVRTGRIVSEQRFVFDVRTEGIVSESGVRQATRWRWWVTLGTVVVGVVVWVALRWRSRRWVADADQSAAADRARD